MPDTTFPTDQLNAFLPQGMEGFIADTPQARPENQPDYKPNEKDLQNILPAGMTGLEDSWVPPQFRNTMSQARREIEARPEGTGSYLARQVNILGIPRLIDDTVAHRARERIRKGIPEGSDFLTLANYEQEHSTDEARSTSEKIGTEVAKLPVLAAEFMAGGVLARGASSALRLAPRAASSAPTILGRAGEALADWRAWRSAAGMTAATPSMYLPKLSEINQQAGRDPTSLVGLPSAFAHGMLNMAVLGSISEYGANIPGNTINAFANRLSRKVGLGMAEQQGIDLFASAVSTILPEGYKLDTGYGLIGDAIEAAKGKKAWSDVGTHAVIQAVQFAAFGALHDGGGVEHLQPYVEVMRTLRKEGLSKHEADVKIKALQEIAAKSGTAADFEPLIARLPEESKADRALKKYAEQLLPDLPQGPPKPEPALGGQVTNPETQPEAPAEGQLPPKTAPIPPPEPVKGSEVAPEAPKAAEAKPERPVPTSQSETLKPFEGVPKDILGHWAKVVAGEKITDPVKLVAKLREKYSDEQIKTFSDHLTEGVKPAPQGEKANLPAPVPPPPEAPPVRREGTPPQEAPKTLGPVPRPSEQLTRTERIRRAQDRLLTARDMQSINAPISKGGSTKGSGWEVPTPPGERFKDKWANREAKPILAPETPRTQQRRLGTEAVEKVVHKLNEPFKGAKEELGGLLERSLMGERLGFDVRNEINKASGWNEKEAKFIWDRIGSEDVPPRTLESLGEEMGMTKEGARQFEIRTLHKAGPNAQSIDKAIRQSNRLALKAEAIKNGKEKNFSDLDNPAARTYLTADQRREKLASKVVDGITDLITKGMESGQLTPERLQHLVDAAKTIEESPHKSRKIGESLGILKPTGKSISEGTNQPETPGVQEQAPAPSQPASQAPPSRVGPVPRVKAGAVNPHPPGSLEAKKWDMVKNSPHIENWEKSLYVNPKTSTFLKAEIEMHAQKKTTWYDHVKEEGISESVFKSVDRKEWTGGNDPPLPRSLFKKKGGKQLDSTWIDQMARTMPAGTFDGTAKDTQKALEIIASSKAFQDVHDYNLDNTHQEFQKAMEEAQNGLWQKVEEAYPNSTHEEKVAVYNRHEPNLENAIRSGIEVRVGESEGGQGSENVGDHARPETGAVPQAVEGDQGRQTERPGRSVPESSGEIGIEPPEPATGGTAESGAIQPRPGTGGATEPDRGGIDRAKEALRKLGWDNDVIQEFADSINQLAQDVAEKRPEGGRYSAENAKREIESIIKSHDDRLTGEKDNTHELLRNYAKEIIKEKESASDIPFEGQFMEGKDPAKGILSSATKSMEEQGIGGEDRTHFLGTLTKVLGQMEPAAVEKVEKIGVQFHWYENPDSLKVSVKKQVEEFARRMGKRVRPSNPDEIIGGAVFVDHLGEQHLHLDGGKETHGRGRRLSEEYYAHELGHILSGKKGSERLSDNPQWVEAYNAEMKAGQLGEYAIKSVEEGFAEFHRHLVKATKEGTLPALAEKAPKAYAFFEEQGFAKKVEAKAGKVDKSDVFSERIPLDNKGGHADVAKPQEFIPFDAQFMLDRIIPERFKSEKKRGSEETWKAKEIEWEPIKGLSGVMQDQTGSFRVVKEGKNGFSVIHYQGMGPGKSKYIAEGLESLDAAKRFVEKFIEEQKPSFHAEFMAEKEATSHSETLKEKAKEIGRGLLKTVKGAKHELAELGGKMAPRTTEQNREAGELLSRFNAAPELAKRLSKEVPNQILGRDSTPAQEEAFGAAATEYALRKTREGHLEQAEKYDAALMTAKKALRDATTPSEKKKWARQVAKLAMKATESLNKKNNVRSVIGEEGNPHKTEADYQAYMNSPEGEKVKALYKEHAKPITEDIIRRVKGLAPDEPIRSITQDPEFPVNLKAIREGDTTEGSGVVRFSGNLRGMKESAPGQTRERSGASALGYDINFRRMWEHAMTQGIPKAAKIEMNRGLIEKGLAQRAEPGQKIEGMKEFPNVYDKKRGDKRTSLYVKEEIYPEYRKAINTDEKSNIPFVTPAMNVATKLNLMGPMDAVGHLKNQATSVFKPFMNWILYGKSIVRSIWKNNPEQEARLTKLTRMGAGPHSREEGAGGKLNPGNWFGKTIQVMDEAGRVTADHAFDEMVKRNLVEDTETNRRDFVNQLFGQYNHAAQSKIVRLLKDSGFGPFAVAATNYTAQGLKMMTLSPSVTAKDTSSAVRLRLEVAKRVGAAMAVVAAANFALWKNVFGDENTPIGAVKTGEKNGKTQYFDLVTFTGFTRGARTSGISATAEGVRRGQRPGRIVDHAVEDILHGLVHPAIGPGVSAAWTAATGRDTLGRDIAPASGFSHAGDRLLAAATHSNAIANIAFGGDVRPGEESSVADRAKNIMGPFNPYRDANLKDVTEVYSRIHDMEEQRKVAQRKGQIYQDEGKYKRLKSIEHRLSLLGKAAKTAPPERQREIRAQMRSLAQAGLGS